MKKDELRIIQSNEKSKPHAGITFCSGLLIRGATCLAATTRVMLVKVKRNWESLRHCRRGLVRNHQHIQIWLHFQPLKMEAGPMLSIKMIKEILRKQAN